MAKRMKTKEIQENLVETMRSWQKIEDASPHAKCLFDTLREKTR